jgi:hypothetical protein
VIAREGAAIVQELSSATAASPRRELPPALATLRSWMRPQKSSVERCELCGAELRADHQHVLDPARRELVCACDACAALFDPGGGARFRPLPRAIRRLADVRCTEALWESLGIPINLAFFRRSVSAGNERIAACYPSPAGPIESTPPADSWMALVAANPAIGRLAPEVEALLANRIGGADEWFLTPLDECYKLVGLIRGGWRGLGGGPQAWQQVESFFRRLRETCRLG